MKSKLYGCISGAWIFFSLFFLVLLLIGAGRLLKKNERTDFSQSITLVVVGAGGLLFTTAQYRGTRDDKASDELEEWRAEYGAFAEMFHFCVNNPEEAIKIYGEGIRKDIIQWQKEIEENPDEYRRIFIDDPRFHNWTKLHPEWLGEYFGQQNLHNIRGYGDYKETKQKTQKSNTHTLSIRSSKPFGVSKADAIAAQIFFFGIPALAIVVIIVVIVVVIFK